MKSDAEIVGAIRRDITPAARDPVEAAVEPANTDLADGDEFKIHGERAIRHPPKLDRTVQGVPLILPERKSLLIIQMGRKLLRPENDFLNPAADGLSTRLLIIHCQ